MWIDFKKPKRHRSAHDVSRVRPHKSYHAYALWHLQYLSTAVLRSNCPPQRGVVAELCAFVFSTLTHALKHLEAQESIATVTLTVSLSPPHLFGVQNRCGPFTGGLKRVNQTCTEVVLGRVRATDLELGESLTHVGAKSGRPNPEAKSGPRIWNSETQSPTFIKKENPQSQALLRES